MFRAVLLWRRGITPSLWGPAAQNGVKGKKLNFRSSLFALSHRPYCTPNPEEEEAEVEDVSTSNLQHSISLYDKDGNKVTDPPKVDRFAQLPEYFGVDRVPKWLLRNLIEHGKYDKTTPVQGVAFNVLKEKSTSIVSLAPTGSGKTIAFGVPSIIAAFEEKRPLYEEVDGYIVCLPKVLVVAPSRELVQQTVDVYERLLQGSRLSVAGVYGGVKGFIQLNQMQRNGCDIVVCTPGRLIQFLHDQKVSLRETKYLILDEADRMLELGFVGAMETIFEALGPQPTVQFWTATWPKGAKKMADVYMPANTVRVRVQQQVRITHNFLFTRTVRDKIDALVDLYDQGLFHGKMKALVFAGKKQWISEIMAHVPNRIHKHNVIVREIHSDLPQVERDRSLNMFREGKCQLLVASDLMGRGIDVPIEAMVNFDLFMADIDQYMHRVGRTGRAGRTGEAYTFIDDTVGGWVIGDLVDKLEKLGQKVPEELRQRAQLRSGGAAKGKSKFKGENMAIVLPEFLFKKDPPAVVDYARYIALSGMTNQPQPGHTQAAFRAFSEQNGFTSPYFIASTSDQLGSFNGGVKKHKKAVGLEIINHNGAKQTYFNEQQLYLFQGGEGQGGGYSQQQQHNPTPPPSQASSPIGGSRFGNIISKAAWEEGEKKRRDFGER